MSGHSGVAEIVTAESFKSFLVQTGSSLSVIHFAAKWAPQCQQMNDVMEELLKASQNSNIGFAKLEAEDVPELSEKYQIVAVPTFIFFKNGSQIDRLDGANATELTKKVSALSASSINVSAPPDPPKPDLKSRLKGLINAAPVMLFMKGTPEEPRCGFSKQTIHLLNERNIQYSTFNILTDDEVRQGLKKYSNWPTFPQLYSKGELLGGLDILKEMVEAGDLDDLPKLEDLNDRLKVLINRDPIMLFMKGNPEEVKCGFSRQIVSILQEAGLKYGSFDILSDEEVRQGLKKYSNWPTYPQLYVNGELIGGLDIIKELKESGELHNILTEGQK